LVQKYQGTNKPKVFAAYDPVDESSRPIEVLK
jgi:hypothetical protein